MQANCKKILFPLVFSCAVALNSPGYAQWNTNNPVFNSFNKAVEFKNIKSPDITSAVDDVIVQAKKDIKVICDIPEKEKTYENTLLALDNVFNYLSNVSGVAGLLVNVSPDDNIRTAAEDNSIKLQNFYTDLSLNEDLYNAIKTYSGKREAKQLKGFKKKFLKDQLMGFERNGFKLNSEKREELKKIQNKLTELNLEFNKNIAEYKDSLIVNDNDIDGLPEDYKTAHRRADGKYVIDLTYPSYIPFMRLSKSDAARKDLWVKYNNKSADKNLKVLKELLEYREKMASLLGYKTFAQYRTEDRMAKTAGAVWEFEEGILNKVKEKTIYDYKQLIDVKKKFLRDNSVKKVEPWETAFYNDILLKDEYQLDNELVKEYFSVDNVIGGLMQTVEKLFDIKFKEIPEASLWYDDVRMFEVIRDGKIISRFYLDLYPRDNKFGHAMCTTIIGGKLTDNGYQMPNVALVCNFPKATADKPALMPHSDAETLFHEFGHALHMMLANSELSLQAGTNVAWDYVETPSQLMENWVWNYESLKTFARHYKTGEILPKDLFDKMVAAKNVGSGLVITRQVFYGVLDMTLHDKYNTNASESTTDVVKKLSEKILPYGYVEGTHLEAGFGHLTDYAAGYYSYLWSLVYAQDIFSRFEEKGIFDKNTGKRLYDMILSKGNSVEEMKQVKDFLGRKPNQDAFIKSLGLTDMKK